MSATYDGDAPDTAARIGALLIQRGETVAVVEAAAGGLISGALVSIPGASTWFQGGVVAYGAAAKSRWLGMSPEAFLPHGVVSETAALALAQAVRDSVDATWGLAEVGIAGPQAGRRSQKGRQPATPEEHLLAKTAAEECPCDSIGHDG